MDEAVKAARKPLLEAARDQAISDMCERARQVALRAGADPATLQIVEQEEVALSYLPGSATRIKVSTRLRRVQGQYLHQGQGHYMLQGQGQ